MDKLVEQQTKQIMKQSSIEHQYLDLLQDILDNGTQKKDRTGTGTLSVFGRQIRHKMSEGYPLLTTKKMAFKTMVKELLWFLRGSTRGDELTRQGCHIWDGDMYSNYLKNSKSEKDDGPFWMRPEVDFQYLTREKFIEKIKTDDEFAKKWGDLGPIYGAQWRNWNGIGIDQIQNAINLLKTDPDSRRNKVDAWNVGEVENQTVPPCHTDFQFYTRELSIDERFDYFTKNSKNVTSHHKLSEHVLKNTPTRAISLMFNMRSNDVPLGLPFNIASYGLLLEIFGKMVNMVPDELIASLGDAHIYKNQIDGVKEQLTREPYSLPKLKHLKTDNFYKTLSDDLSLVSHLDNNDFELIDYQSHPKIDIPLSN